MSTKTTLYSIDGENEPLCPTCALCVLNSGSHTINKLDKSDEPCVRCLPPVPKNRNPYREIRVCDHTGKSIRTNPKLVLRVWPNGILQIREARRREFVETTVAVLYESRVWAEAMKSLREKRKAGASRRQGQRR